MNRVAAGVVLLALFGVFMWIAITVLGPPLVFVSEIGNVSHAPKVPPWAKVAPEQIAEAKKHGVPVAFENDLGMRFVLIPAGTFVMGSPEDEEHRNLGGDEHDEAQHEVTLTRPIYVQLTEVTNQQFRAWQGDHNSRTHESEGSPRVPLDRRDANGDGQPAIGVSWEEAVGFAHWLSASDASRTYDLPDEARWEYACRAGTNTVFSFGDSLTSDQASILGAFPYPDVDPDGNPYPVGIERRATTPVGMFPANRWGLHDMHGNAREWCLDWMDWELTGPVTDPNGPSSGEFRVLRGGAWNLPGLLARSAARAWGAPDGGGPHVGFRLVSPLPERKSNR